MSSKQDADQSKKKNSIPEKKPLNDQRKIAKLQACVKGTEDWKPLGQLLKELNPVKIEIAGKVTWRKEPLPLNSAPKEAPQDSLSCTKEKNCKL